MLAFKDYTEAAKRQIKKKKKKKRKKGKILISALQTIQGRWENLRKKNHSSHEFWQHFFCSVTMY